VLRLTVLVSLADEIGKLESQIAEEEKALEA
jgi:hypothetical protein